MVNKPISYINNNSSLYGKYTDNLKISKSIFISKNKGSKNETINHRNISIET